MSIPEELSKQIETRIKEFVASEDSLPTFMRSFAARFNLLPLYVDWTHCTGIQPDGELVTFSHEDEDQKLHVEADARWRNIALFLGSQKYPELSVLVPERPSDAFVCPQCKGTGVIPGFLEMGFNPEVLHCYCGGMGWVPPGFEVDPDS